MGYLLIKNRTKKYEVNDIHFGFLFGITCLENYGLIDKFHLFPSSSRTYWDSMYNLLKTIDYQGNVYITKKFQCNQTPEKTAKS